MRFLLAAAAAFVLASCAASPDNASFVAGADGNRLYVRWLGHGGDTVVVLHGGPALHHGYLLDALRPLARDRTFLFYDQRARGRSDTVPDTLALSLERDVADLEALRLHYQLEHLTLIGHGWGGGVAARYALAHPDRVERLALVSPFFPRATFLFGVMVMPYEGPDSAAFAGLTTARLEHLDENDPASFCRRYWGAWLSPIPVRDAYATRRLAPAVCDAPPAVLGRIERVKALELQSLGPWDWRPERHGVVAPTLLLQGTGKIWHAAAREWLDRLPQARLVTLAAHPQFPWLDHEREFRAALAAFLDGAWPSGAVAADSARP
jgi:proline iminopeptidase